MTAFTADDCETGFFKKVDEFFAGELGEVGHGSEVDAVNPDEPGRFRRFFLRFQVHLDRFAQALFQSVHGLGLGVTAGEFQNGRDEVPLRVTLHDGVVFPRLPGAFMLDGLFHTQAG